MQTLLDFVRLAAAVAFVLGLIALVRGRLRLWRLHLPTRKAAAVLTACSVATMGAVGELSPSPTPPPGAATAVIPREAPVSAAPEVEAPPPTRTPAPVVSSVAPRPTPAATPTPARKRRSPPPPPPPRTSAPPARNCDPSYPTVCIPPPPPDLDCGDIPYRNFPVRPPDPHRFDADNDGIGCES